MLAGQVGGHGAITGRDGRIVIEAPGDTCWLVVGRFDQSNGGEAASFRPHVAELAAVQPFRFRLGAHGKS